MTLRFPSARAASLAASLLCAGCQSAPSAGSADLRVGEDCALRPTRFADLARGADWLALGPVTRVIVVHEAGGLFEGDARGWAEVRLDHPLAGAAPRGRLSRFDWSYAWNDTPPFGGGLKPSPGDAYLAWRKAGVVDALPAECVEDLPWPTGVRPGSAGTAAARRLGVPPPK